MLFGKKERQDPWHNTIMEQIRNLESGDLTGIRMAYCAFAAGDGELIRQAGEAIRRQFSPMTSMQMLKICERFREFTSIEWHVDWAKVSLSRIEEELPKETYRYVLILGSFHPNGYFREKCVEAMGDYDRMLFWLFPRVNDWVLEIRRTACRVLKKYLSACDGTELIMGLPAYERLQDCRRRTESQMQELETQIKERLSFALKELDLRKIRYMEPCFRASLYRIAVQDRLWNMQEMEFCLKQEKMSCLKKFLIKRILAHPNCTLAWAEHYLADSSSQVRKAALEFKYEHLKTCWDGLEHMLLDKSKGVRGYAAYILERHSSLDIREYYFVHIQDKKPEYAILGLSEFSRNGNVQVLLKCLERTEGKIEKCTLLALGSQEDFRDEELLWNYLLNDKNDIAKAAYLSICKRGFYLGAERIYEAYRQTQIEHQKKYLLKLLFRESSWNRLPYLLRLYGENMSEEERNRVLSGICCRSMYGSLTEKLAEKILSALEENREKLPDGVEKGILFDMKFLAK